MDEALPCAYRGPQRSIAKGPQHVATATRKNITLFYLPFALFTQHEPSRNVVRNLNVAGASTHSQENLAFGFTVCTLQIATGSERQCIDPSRMHCRDRAEERRRGLNTDYEELHREQKERGMQWEKFSAEETKFLGGDMDRAHLVKGLDYQLLHKAREPFLLRIFSG